MTQREAIEHWLTGAQKALRAAKVLQEDENFEPALFECHLCVVKALKAAYLREHDEAPPPAHDLIALADVWKREWSEEERQHLRTLSRFVVDARYADPPWALEYATKDNTAYWVDQAEHFLTILSS